MSGGVMIGQAAAFAGVTVKTVRHYHKLGLVDEPRRDVSGYRRYGSAELLRLVRVRTLAEAGVPLVEIGPMLDAGAEQFTTALADVERRLNERIEELVARREMLHRLADGDQVLLPDRALALLDRADEFGIPPEDAAIAREGLVLARALVPDGFDDYLDQVEHALGDNRFIDLVRRQGEAASWVPDDPRIEELADAVADHFLANPALLKIITSLQVASDDNAARYGLIRSYGDDQSPTSARLTALIETRLRAAGVPIPHR
jgi:DNA-binding transcriptional MerR regulator